ncbi:unnamed protein product [Moneuplotes crassus]|uniref:Uncharacterized protein n=1 Tax=Euplotes crassus TaxID=5936 RepID=A0AAD1Y5V6_EUPCR|nr:unnamed protein product [Moneuplotes crassus]
MIQANKLQPKIFPSVLLEKSDAASEDCDISDDVLSESSPIASKTGVNKGMKFKSKFWITNNLKMERDEVAGSLNQDFTSANKQNKLIHASSFKTKKNSVDYKCNNCPSVASPRSLKSEISSLLQQLIIKKKKSKETKLILSSQKKSLQTPVSEINKAKEDENFIPTMGDIDKPSKAS